MSKVRESHSTDELNNVRNRIAPFFGQLASKYQLSADFVKVGPQHHRPSSLPFAR